MPFSIQTIPITSAVLSGGMQLKAAGGGLPQRLTGQDDIVFEPRVSSGGVQEGIIFDPDNLHFWVPKYNTASNNLVKYRISDCGAAQTITVATSTNMSLFRRANGTSFFVAQHTANQYQEVRYSDGAILATYASPVGAAIVVETGTMANTAWVMPFAGGTVTEVTISTGLATGRTIVVAGLNSLYATANFIWISTSAGIVRKYNESDLSIADTWTATSSTNYSSISNVFGTYGYGSLIVDGSGRPIVVQGLYGSIERLKSTGGSGTAMFDKRLFYGAQPQLRGTAHSPTTSILYRHFAFSDDGKYAVFSTLPTTTNNRQVRRVNIGTQRARFAVPYATASTVKYITIPGLMGNHWDGTDDFRRTKFYYSTDGGSIRTEFSPGSELAVSVGAGGTLTVDVDINESEGKLFGPAPYVEGSLAVFAEESAQFGSLTALPGGVLLLTLQDNLIPSLTGDAATASKWTITGPTSETVNAVYVSDRTLVLRTTHPTQLAGSYTLNVPNGVVGGGSAAYRGPFALGFTGPGDTLTILQANAIEAYKLQIVLNAPPSTTVYNPANYVMTGGISVVSVAKSTDLVYVLTTSHQLIGSSYSITCPGVVAGEPYFTQGLPDPAKPGYFGIVTDTGVYNSAFITGLPSSTNIATYAGTFEFMGANGVKKAFYAFPSAYGTPSLIVESTSWLEFPFTRVAQNVAVSGVNYDVWRSDFAPTQSSVTRWF